MAKLPIYLYLLIINLIFFSSISFAAEIKIQINRITNEGAGNIIGSIILKDSHLGMKIIPNLSGLTEGNHAFHVHENPSCMSGVKNGKKIAGLMAGGHFDPKKGVHKKHHNHTNKHNKNLKPHGDLPELVADVNGYVTISVMTNNIEVSQLRGRSLMVHRYGESDIGKPKGGGPRIACGVIKK
jgi:Cu-Zn family superoxide dismutase